MAVSPSNGRKAYPPLVEVGGVILSTEILTEYFCCDLAVCKGVCCIEGDSGAPLQLEEVEMLEGVLDEVWPDLGATAQSLIDRQGVAYTDCEGDLVTSIVNGKNCVFTCGGADGCCCCAVDKAYREGRVNWRKPISCELYPIREKKLSNGLIGLHYDRWKICWPAIQKGLQEELLLYEFLREPLIRRFGKAWYHELCTLATELKKVYAIES